MPEAQPEPVVEQAPAAPLAADVVTDDVVIASITIGETQVTLPRDRYLAFLEETRGLDAVLNLMQLELAKQQATELGVDPETVDVEAEVRRTLDTGFRGPDGEVLEIGDYDAALQRVLAEQGLSRAEFDVVMETNAMLRAAAGERIRQQVTDEMLLEDFNRRYGEQAVVRVIAFDSLRDAAEVRRQIEDADDFIELASTLNEDASLAARQGLIEPFTRQSDFPKTIKDAAFALEEGDVSEPVESEGKFLLLRLEERRAPTVVAFEDVKDDLRAQLIDNASDALITQYRRLMAGALTSQALELEDPMLAEQLQARLIAAQPQPVEDEAFKERLEQERPATTMPATRRNMP
ncbi:MAG: peptidylprolyl isomerase [Planctomycetota bacterium]